MTDEKRCEPPEHLRGSDGEHFVCGPNGVPFVALWHAAPHAGIEPLWHNAARTSTGTPAWAANEWGWRYVAPVTPQDTVAALVGALEESEKMLDYVSTFCRKWAVVSQIGGWSTHQVVANIVLAENAESSLGCVRAALALYRKENRQ